MKIRKNCPKNNKYYIRTVSGGLNGAVAGYPKQPYADVLDNCVGGANGRFNEIINDPDLKGIVKKFKYQLVCNAENFIESAKAQGLKISETPVEGGIMVWQKGKTLSGSDGAGHVAVVERVYNDGTILTSESGWASWAWKTVRRDNTEGRWGQNENYKFRGCIINPGIKNPKVVPVPKLDVDGIGGNCTVRAMQRYFKTPQDGVISGQNKALKKCYPSLTAVEFGEGGSAVIRKLQKWVGATQDGIIGKNTVKAWQKRLGLDETGVFSDADMKAWQKWLNKKLFPADDDYPEWVKKANAWAEELADDPKAGYRKFDGKDKSTYECLLCHPETDPKGKWPKKTGNCIWESFAYWHHGGGIKCNCSCHVLDDAFMTKLLTMSYKKALKQLKKKVGNNNIDLIRNDGKNIPDKDTKPGDLCIMYDSKKKATHIYPYIGNGYMIDCGNYSDKKKQIAKRKAGARKVIIRYLEK